MTRGGIRNSTTVAQTMEPLVSSGRFRQNTPHDQPNTQGELATALTGQWMPCHGGGGGGGGGVGGGGGGGGAAWL